MLENTHESNNSISKLTKNNAKDIILEDITIECEVDNNVTKFVVDSQSGMSGGQGGVYTFKNDSKWILKTSTNKRSIEIEVDNYKLFRYQLETYIPKLFVYSIKTFVYKNKTYYYFIMERFDECLGKQHTKKVKDIFNSLVNTLNLMHNLGYVHHDIKPQNIMFKKGSNKPILIDFGMSVSYYPSVYQTKFFGTKTFSSVYTLLTNNYYSVDDYISLCWTFLNLFQNIPWKLPNTSNNFTQQEIKDKIAIFQYSWIIAYKDSNPFAKIVDSLMQLPHNYLVVVQTKQVLLKSSDISISKLSGDKSFNLLPFNVLDKFKSTVTNNSGTVDWSKWSEMRLRSLKMYMQSSLNTFVKIYNTVFKNTVVKYLDNIITKTEKITHEYFNYQLNENPETKSVLSDKTDEEVNDYIFYKNSLINITEYIKTHIHWFYYYYLKFFSTYVNIVQKIIYNIKENTSVSNIIALFNGDSFKQYLYSNLNLFDDNVKKNYEYIANTIFNDISTNIESVYMSLFNDIDEFTESHIYFDKVMESISLELKFTPVV